MEENSGLTVLSRSSAAAVLSAPMRSVREQPCPKRFAIRPSTDSHKRMMPDLGDLGAVRGL